MNQDRKRQLQEAYKNRKVVGCVFIVRNAKNGRFYLNYSDVSAAAKNTFDLAVSSGTAYKPVMINDWKEHGASAFSFEILEEIEKTEEQSDREFRDDLATLTDLWLEKLSEPGARYL